MNRIGLRELGAELAQRERSMPLASCGRNQIRDAWKTVIQHFDGLPELMPFSKP